MTKFVLSMFINLAILAGINGLKDFVQDCGISILSIVWKYTIIIWIIKIHSISNKGPYNFHSMSFYGFSVFFQCIQIKLPCRLHLFS